MKEIARVLDGEGPDTVGFCLDTVHAMLVPGPPLDCLRGFGSRLIVVHWHGNNATDDARAFPSAHDDWEEFPAASDDANYDLPMPAEAAPPDGVPFEEAVRLVRSIIRPYRA